MTKKEICNKINSSYLKLDERKYEGKFDEIEIKIPVYKSSLKKRLISILAFFLKDVYYSKVESKKISRIDFSEYIKPDDWIVYKENKNGIPLMAIPKYVSNHKNCWKISLTAEFYKEDLRYGVKPKTIFKHLPVIGLGPIIWGKKSNKKYQLGSGHWAYHDVIEEYDKFVNNGKSEFEWKQLEIEIE